LTLINTILTDEKMGKTAITHVNYGEEGLKTGPREQGAGNFRGAFARRGSRCIGTPGQKTEKHLKAGKGSKAPSKAVKKIRLKKREMRKSQ